MLVMIFSRSAAPESRTYGLSDEEDRHEHNKLYVQSVLSWLKAARADVRAAGQLGARESPISPKSKIRRSEAFRHFFRIMTT